MFHYSILNKKNCRRRRSGSSYRTVGFDCCLSGKGTFRGLTRFVPLDGDISCADTVVFGAERFFLKKTADFALALELPFAV